MSRGLVGRLWDYAVRDVYALDVPVEIPHFRGLRVVDVGSGYNPRLIADVMVNNVDIYEGKRTVKCARRYLTADIARLPFLDGAFDLAIANHVFEHLPDPQVAFQEMCRVARSVLIVTPSAYREARGTDDDHYWFVYGDSGELVFEAIPPGFRTDPALRQAGLARFEAVENDLVVGDETVYFRQTAHARVPLVAGAFDSERHVANQDLYRRRAAEGIVVHQRFRKRAVFALKSVARRWIWTWRRPLDPTTYMRADASE